MYLFNLYGIANFSYFPILGGEDVKVVRGAGVVKGVVRVVRIFVKVFIGDNKTCTNLKQNKKKKDRSIKSSSSSSEPLEMPLHKSLERSTIITGIQ